MLNRVHWILKHFIKIKSSNYYFLNKYFLSRKSFESFDLSQRIWITSCRPDICLNALNKCIDSNCFTIDQCKHCVIDESINCAQCAIELFNEKHLQNINETSYLICDPNDNVQVTGCQLYCRGKLFSNGHCERVENFPVCKCEENFSTISLTKTTTISTTQTTTEKPRPDIIT